MDHKATKQQHFLWWYVPNGEYTSSNRETIFAHIMGLSLTAHMLALF